MRMRLQMLHVRRRQFARVNFLWLQKLRRVQQPGILDSLRQVNGRTIMLVHHHFFRLNQVGDSLLRPQGQFRLGKTLDDFLQ